MTERTGGVDARPVPAPDEVSAFYWEGAGRGELLVQRCRACQTLQFPPEVACTTCQSLDLQPEAMSGDAELWSYSVVERPFHAGFVDVVPYVVGLVELREQPGLRILTNVVEAEIDDLEVGMALEVTYERRGDVTLPQFRPAEATR